jgi:hypothetical protein
LVGWRDDQLFKAHARLEGVAPRTDELLRQLGAGAIAERKRIESIISRGKRQWRSPDAWPT